MSTARSPRAPFEFGSPRAERVLERRQYLWGTRRRNSARIPSCRWKCFRYMQIRFFLNWPARFLRPDRDVGFLRTRKYFWAITPTAYRGISGTAKSPTPRGACHESLRFPLFPPATQEAGDSPVRGDHDEKVPPLRR